MKWIARLLILLVLAGAVFSLFSNRLITNYAVSAIEERSGFKVEVGDLDVGFLRPIVRIENLKLTNPPGFPYEEAFTVKEFYVRYDRMSLFRQNIHLDELRLDIPRVVMVNPENGDSNVEILSKMGKKEKPVPDPGEAAPDSGKQEPSSEPKKATEEKRTVSIGNLHVKLGEMEVRRYRPNQPEPAVMNVPVNLDRSYENVTNVDSVVKQLTSELVLRSGFGLINQLGAKISSDGSPKSDEKIKEQLEIIKSLFKKNSK
jgi:uncharacterized protein involved in outer membrane biogenesis